MATIKVRGTPATEIPNTVNPARRAGTAQAATKPSGLELDGMTVTSKMAVWTAGVRAAVQEEIVIPDVNEDDVLAIEIEGDLQLLTRFDDFKRDFPGSAVRALSGNDDFQLNPNLGLPGAQRVLGTVLMKGLEVFGVKVDQDGALRFAHKVEEKLRLGLRRLTGDPQVVLSENLDARFGDRVALIFIHGTGSSTRGEPLI